MSPDELARLSFVPGFSATNFWDKRYKSFGAAGGGSVKSGDLDDPSAEVAKIAKAYLGTIKNVLPHKTAFTVYIGCGGGRLLPMVFEFSRKVHGLDISEVALEVVRDDFSWLLNNILEVMRCSEFDEQYSTIPTDSVDVVFTHALFKHVRMPYAGFIISEIRRILKKGGYYVGIEPTWSPEVLEGLEEDALRTHMSYRTKECFLKMLEDGFQMVSTKEHLYVMEVKK